MNEKGVFILPIFTSASPEMQVGIMKQSVLYEKAWYSRIGEFESDYSRNTTVWD